jgi:hypothetical protein
MRLNTAPTGMVMNSMMRAARRKPPVKFVKKELVETSGGSCT